MSSSSSSLCSSPNENFIFKCDQHSTNISDKLHLFYQEKDFFDTILIAGNNCISIPSHKIVLSALSEYFWEMFHGKPTISNTNQVELKEIEAPTLQLIVDYMYSGWIELNLENIEIILRSAVFLKMKLLIDGCCDFLEKILNNSNCLHWLHLAKELCLSDGLREKSLNFIYNHMGDVTKEPEFLLLNVDELKDLLFNDNARREDLEEQVFLSLTTWIQYEEVDRQHLLPELLSMVRYQFLAPRFIIKNRTSVDNCELVCDWLQYHLWPESRTIEEQNFTFNYEKVEQSQLEAIYVNDHNEAEILCYNETLPTWPIRKKAKPLLKMTRYSSGTFIDEKLFLVEVNDTNVITTNCVNCLDPKALELTDMPPLQIAKYGSQFVNLNGYLFVFGSLEKDKGNCIPSMEIFNFSTRKWRDLQLPFKLEMRHKLAAHNGILYICDFGYSCVHCYDISSNQWTSKEQRSKFCTCRC